MWDVLTGYAKTAFLLEPYLIIVDLRSQPRFVMAPLTVNLHRRRVWPGLLLLGLLLPLEGCISDKVPCDKFDFGLKIEKWPPSTQIVQENCWTGFNPSYRSEFTIAPQDLPILQQQAPLNKIKEWRTDTTSQIFTDSEFHQQGKKMRSLLYADYSDGSYLIEVLIDMGNIQKYVVYVSNTYVD